MGNIENLEGEIWKDIEGYEGRYKISNIGRVKSVNRLVNLGENKKFIRERVLATIVHKFGYEVISIRSAEGKQKQVKVHRLVAKAFIKNPKSFSQINHMDGNKLNNHISNLEWISASNNQLHAISIGLRYPFTRNYNPTAKLSYEEVRQIKDEYIPYKVTAKILAKKYKVHECTIYKILNIKD